MSTVKGSSELMLIGEASEMLGLSPATIRKLSAEGDMPYVKITPNAQLRYRRSDLLKWVESKSVRPKKGGKK